MTRPLGYHVHITRAKAIAKGFTVDDTCYPHLAYKGPRFAPTDYCRVVTDLEAELAAALRPFVAWYQRPEGNIIAFIRPEEWKAAVEALAKLDGG